MESILLNGTGRHVVMSSGRVSTLTIFGNFLYWVEELGASVKRADKVIGANTQLLAVGYQVSALQVFAKERQNCKFNKVESKDVSSSSSQSHGRITCSYF